MSDLSTHLHKRQNCLLVWDDKTKYYNKYPMIDLEKIGKEKAISHSYKDEIS